jgi:PKD repeat protein
MGVSYSTDNGTTFTDYAELYKSHQFTTIGTAGEDALWAGAFSSGPYDGGMWHYGNISSTADFSVNNTQFCVNDENIEFTDESTGFPESWSWNFGEGASPATATGDGPHTISYSSAGEKDITLTITKGLDNNEVIHKNLLFINGTIPDDAGEITGETTVMAGETHPYSVSNQTETSFIWDIEPWTGTSTTNNIDIEFTGASGTASISVTPQNGCGDGASSSLEITASPSTGIKDIENNNSFSVYPNPAKDYINISDIGNSKVYIYNSQGVLIKNIDLKGQTPINISDLKNGIYILKACNDKKEYTKTFSQIIFIILLKNLASNSMPSFLFFLIS